MWWLLVGMMPAHALDCDQRGLDRAIRTFDEAFATLDLESFQESYRAIQRQTGCMKEPLSAVHVADLHRVKAFDAYVSDDRAATILYFQSLQATQPGYVLPVDLVPEEHPMQALFAQARSFDAGGSVELPEPAVGRLTVDGGLMNTAPSGRPWVFQQLEDRNVLQTRYVEVGEPLPTYELRGKERRRSARARQFTRIGASVFTAGLLVYGGSALTRRSYDNAVELGDAQRIDRSHTQTNGLAVTGVATMAIGVGMVGFSFAL